VDLYADWCQPCKQLEPILQQLSEELAGKVKVVRVDVERSPALARAFRVQSIPMLVLLKDGRPVDQIIGLANKQTILEMLQPFLPVNAQELSPQDLAVLLQSGRALPVDVRDAGAFARYHIPGAINVPAAELAQRLSELRPTDGRLRVLYGRGGDDAKELVQKALEGGVTVSMLAGGFLHWEAAGLGVERGG
jgi:thioredoxin